MKKVLGAMSRFIFAGFGIAVLALLMSLTYGALQRLFPGNFANQMWGLVMFDIAAMCWAIAFVFQSKSTGQYAAAGIGFIVAFVGTLGMVAAEVMLSGTTLTPEQTAQIGKWMTYGFIVVTAIHAALIYAHHATAPEIHEQINVGVARGEIVTEAITQATKVLDEQKQDLAYSIRNDIISKAKRDLGLIEADPRMPIIPRRYEQTVPVPAEVKAMYAPGTQFTDGTSNPLPATQTKPAFSLANLLPFTWPKSKPKTATREQPDQAGVSDNYGPEWKNSTNVSPTLDAYAWVCLHCDGHNRPHTPACSWCGQPRTNGSPVTAFADIPPTPKAEDAKPASDSPFPIPRD